MIKVQATRAYLRIGLGGGLFMTGAAVAFDPGDVAPTPLNLATTCAGLSLELIGIVCFIWGCCIYCKAKGYHGAVGMMGLIPILGWIGLCVLPDLRKEHEVPGFPVIYGKSER